MAAKGESVQIIKRGKPFARVVGTSNRKAFSAACGPPRCVGLNFDEASGFGLGGHEVTYLLDTNVWLRGIIEPTTLPEDIRRLLDKRDAQFGLSAISLWEVGKKHQIGKLELKKELGAWLSEAVSAHVQVLLNPAIELVAEAMGAAQFSEPRSGG